MIFGLYLLQYSSHDGVRVFLLLQVFLQCFYRHSLPQNTWKHTSDQSVQDTCDWTSLMVVRQFFSAVPVQTECWTQEERLRLVLVKRLEER